MRIRQAIDTAIGVVFSILLGVTIFFLKNLVTKVESTDDSVWQVKIEMGSLKTEVSLLSARIERQSQFMLRQKEKASYGSEGLPKGPPDEAL